MQYKITTQASKTKYSDTDLNEFRELINEKIKMPREELTDLAGTLSSSNSNGDDAADAGKILEDGSFCNYNLTDANFISPLFGHKC